MILKSFVPLYPDRRRYFSIRHRCSPRLDHRKFCASPSGLKLIFDWHVSTLVQTSTFSDTPCCRNEATGTPNPSLDIHGNSHSRQLSIFRVDWLDSHWRDYFPEFGVIPELLDIQHTSLWCRAGKCRQSCPNKIQPALHLSCRSNRQSGERSSRPVKLLSSFSGNWVGSSIFCKTRRRP